MRRILFGILLAMVPIGAMAQCIVISGGTICTGPVLIQPSSSDTTQSSIGLIDRGMPSPVPAPKFYFLSISGGIIMESDDGSSYHSLVGPRGATGATGATGPRGVVVGTVLTGVLTCQNGLGGTKHTSICTYTVTGVQ